MHRHGMFDCVHINSKTQCVIVTSRNGAIQPLCKAQLLCILCSAQKRSNYVNDRYNIVIFYSAASWSLHHK